MTGASTARRRRMISTRGTTEPTVRLAIPLSEQQEVVTGSAEFTSSCLVRPEQARATTAAKATDYDLTRALVFDLTHGDILSQRIHRFWKATRPPGIDRTSGQSGTCSCVASVLSVEA